VESVIASIVSAAPGIMIGVAAILSARRAHITINNQVKPDIEQVQEAVKNLQDGTLP
jgi:hypothetical protein